MTRPISALLALLLLEAGCACGVSHDDTPGDTGSRDDTAPEACGTGTWGDLAIGELTVFVDAAAPASGDGSQGAPLTSIQAGLDAAAGAGEGMVAVAAGSYAEILVLGPEHEGLRLAGRCRELVTLDASVGDGSLAGIDLDLGAGSLEISGLTVQDAPWAGVLVRSGEVLLRDSDVLRSGFGGVASVRTGTSASDLRLERCELADNIGISVVAQQEGSISLLDSVVRDTATMDNGGVLVGIGIQAYTGASLVIEGSTLSGHTGLAIAAGDQGTTLTLRDSTIRDTVPDNTGEGGYAIDLTGGATLEADGCILTENTQVALHATSPGTAATLTGCEISATRVGDAPDTTHALQVDNQAVVTAIGCRLVDNEGPGALVLDQGILLLDSSELAGNVAGGILVRGGGSATISASTIRDGVTDEAGIGGAGLYVYEGGTVEISDCSIEDNRSVGLFIGGETSQATITDSSILGTLPDDHGAFGYAVLAIEGATLLAEGCDFGESTQAGVVTGALDATTGPSVTLRHTTVRGTRFTALGEAGIGLSAQQGATLIAEDCSIVDNATMGVQATEQGTRLVLRRTAVQGTRPQPDGRFGYGVQVSDGAIMEAEDAEIIDSTAIGLLVVDPGSSVVVSGGRITGSQRHGVMTVGLGAVVQEQAQLEATGLEISGNDGPGLLGIDSDTNLGCSGCTISDNRFAGAVVFEGASLALEGCTVRDNLPQGNIGGGVGVHAERWDDEPPSLTLDASTIQGNPIAGVQLLGPGSYQLTDNDIHGGEGWTRGGYTKCGHAVSAADGAMSWDGNTGLRMQDNTLLDATGAGLFLLDSGARLEGNTWTDNTLDLISQGGSCGQAPEGLDDEPIASSELCPGYDYGTCEEGFVLYLEVAELEPGCEDVSARGRPAALVPPMDAGPPRVGAVGPVPGHHLHIDPRLTAR